MREGSGTAVTVAPASATGRVWVPLVTLWIVWGTTYLGTSAMVQTMPPLISAGARYVIGGLALAALLAIIKGPRILRITRRQIMTTAVAGVSIIGVWAALVALALQHIPGGIAALIGATIPLWMILLRIGSGDRVGVLTWVGVATGLLGVAAMLLPGGIASIAGDGPVAITVWSLAVLIASLTYAVSSYRLRTLDLPRSSLVTTTYQLLWGGGVVVVIGLLVGEDARAVDISSASWAGFWWLVFASVLGYATYTYLLQHAPLSLVSTFAFVNPVVAVILGWLLLGEPFSRSVVIGLVVVVTGTSLVVLGEGAFGISRPRRSGGH